jgi:outer membrane protein assembly factor BamB
MRWWPAVLILAGALVALLFIWGGGDADSDRIRQFQVMRTALTLVVSTLLLLLWLTFFSRLSWRNRLKAWGGLLVIVASCVLIFRYRGVSGDFVPILEPRWTGTGTGVTGESLDDLASAHDYPQFLGPSRNATVRGVRLERDWSAQPPKLIWRRPVGAGWSSFAVAGNAAVTQEQRGEQEVVARYDLRTGEERWVTGDPVRYDNPISGEGPRATPTIAGDRVYTVGGTGLLNCLDLETGERVWSQDFLEDNDARSPEWGISGSPLVVDGLVIVSAGGTAGKSLVAYDQETGDIVWQAGSDRAGYSSPFVTTLAGVRQVVIFNHSSVAGHDPTDGAVLWSHEWPPQQPNVAQPVPILGDRLVLSSGYGVGAKLLEIGPGADGALEASLVWENNRLKAKFANFVVHEGFIYGLDDGIMVCLDAATGERRWKGGRYGHGQMILVEDLLLVQTEQGEMVLVEPNPEELRELGRLRLFEGKLWNSPALVGRYLLVRNDREAALFELPVKK